MNHERNYARGRTALIPSIGYALVAVLCSACGGAPAGRVVLFNGVDTTNWTVSPATGDKRGNTDPADFFQASTYEGEAVIRTYPGVPADTSHSGFATLVTSAQYTRYRLHVEYKWGETMFKPYDDPTKRRRDAGLLYHIVDPLSIGTTGFPNSLECQLMEGRLSCSDGCYDALTGDFFGLGLTAQSTVQNGHFLPAEEGGVAGTATKAREGVVDLLDDWNTVELVIDGSVRGDYILNGQLVNQAFGSTVESGHIGLQAESAELYYRNIWLDPIDENTPVQ